MGCFPINHDMHAHTVLSSCCQDPRQTVSNILAHAQSSGYALQCITDHLWDASVPGASPWYAPQDIAHVKRSLPLPPSGGVRLAFGCETEFLGGDKLGLSPGHMNDFDFIIIPPNHFHMADFVRPASVTDPEDIALLLTRRLEEIARLPLPFHKVGIAHLTTGLIRKGGDKYEVLRAVPEERFFDAMRRLQRLGAGIEINGASYKEGWLGHQEDELRLLRLAKAAGCRFYLGSDAHSLEALDRVPQALPTVVSLLGLTDADLFTLD